VPLLVAIFNAALQIQQLADSSRTVASAGIGSARASEDLMSEVLLLERATVLVLADPKNRDVYRVHDTQLTASREQLVHQLNSAEGRQALAQLGALQNLIATKVLAADASTATVRATLPQFDDMSKLAQHIAVQSNVEIDAEIAAIQRRTGESNGCCCGRAVCWFRWRSSPRSC